MKPNGLTILYRTQAQILSRNGNATIGQEMPKTPYKINLHPNLQSCRSALFLPSFHSR